MTRRIYKYLLVGSDCFVDAHEGPVLAVGVQDAFIVVWVLADVDVPRKRRFRCVGTGGDVDDAACAYVGTATVTPALPGETPHGVVWHVFEVA